MESITEEFKKLMFTGSFGLPPTTGAGSADGQDTSEISRHPSAWALDTATRGALAVNALHSGLTSARNLCSSRISTFDEPIDMAVDSDPTANLTPVCFQVSLRLCELLAKLSLSELEQRAPHMPLLISPRRSVQESSVWSAIVTVARDILRSTDIPNNIPPYHLMFPSIFPVPLGQSEIYEMWTNIIILIHYAITQECWSSNFENEIAEELTRRENGKPDADSVQEADNPRETSPTNDGGHAGEHGHSSASHTGTVFANSDLNDHSAGGNGRPGTLHTGVGKFIHWLKTEGERMYREALFHIPWTANQSGDDVLPISGNVSNQDLLRIFTINRGEHTASGDIAFPNIPRTSSCSTKSDKPSAGPSPREDEGPNGADARQNSVQYCHAAFVPRGSTGSGPTLNMNTNPSASANASGSGSAAGSAPAVVATVPTASQSITQPHYLGSPGSIESHFSANSNVPSGCIESNLQLMTRGTKTVADGGSPLHAKRHSFDEVDASASVSRSVVMLEPSFVPQASRTCTLQDMYDLVDDVMSKKQDGDTGAEDDDGNSVRDAPTATAAPGDGVLPGPGPAPEEAHSAKGSSSTQQSTEPNAESPAHRALQGPCSANQGNVFSYFREQANSSEGIVPVQEPEPEGRDVTAGPSAMPLPKGTLAINVRDAREGDTPRSRPMTHPQRASLGAVQPTSPILGVKKNSSTIITRMYSGAPLPTGLSLSVKVYFSGIFGSTLLKPLSLGLRGQLEKKFSESLVYDGAILLAVLKSRGALTPALCFTTCYQVQRFALELGWGDEFLIPNFDRLCSESMIANYSTMYQTTVNGSFSTMTASFLQSQSINTDAAQPLAEPLEVRGASGDRASIASLEISLVNEESWNRSSSRSAITLEPRNAFLSRDPREDDYNEVVLIQPARSSSANDIYEEYSNRSTSPSAPPHGLRHAFSIDVCLLNGLAGAGAGAGAGSAAQQSPAKAVHPQSAGCSMERNATSLHAEPSLDDGIPIALNPASAYETRVSRNFTHPCMLAIFDKLSGGLADIVEKIADLNLRLNRPVAMIPSILTARRDSSKPATLLRSLKSIISLPKIIDANCLADVERSILPVVMDPNCDPTLCQQLTRIIECFHSPLSFEVYSSPKSVRYSYALEPLRIRAEPRGVKSTVLQYLCGGHWRVAISPPKEDFVFVPRSFGVYDYFYINPNYKESLVSPLLPVSGKQVDWNRVLVVPRVASALIYSAPDATNVMATVRTANMFDGKYLDVLNTLYVENMFDPLPLRRLHKPGGAKPGGMGLAFPPPTAAATAPAAAPAAAGLGSGQGAGQGGQQELSSGNRDSLDVNIMFSPPVSGTHLSSTKPGLRIMNTKSSGTFDSSWNAADQNSPGSTPVNNPYSRATQSAERPAADKLRGALHHDIGAAADAYANAGSITASEFDPSMTIDRVINRTLPSWKNDANLERPPSIISQETSIISTIGSLKKAGMDIVVGFDLMLPLPSNSISDLPLKYRPCIRLCDRIVKAGLTSIKVSLPQTTVSYYSTLQKPDMRLDRADPELATQARITRILMDYSLLDTWALMLSELSAMHFKYGFSGILLRGVDYPYFFASKIMPSVKLALYRKLVIEIWSRLPKVPIYAFANSSAHSTMLATVGVIPIMRQSDGAHSGALALSTARAAHGSPLDRMYCVQEVKCYRKETFSFRSVCELFVNKPLPLFNIDDIHFESAQALGASVRAMTTNLGLQSCLANILAHQKSLYETLAESCATRPKLVSQLRCPVILRLLSNTCHSMFVRHVCVAPGSIPGGSSALCYAVMRDPPAKSVYVNVTNALRTQKVFIALPDIGYLLAGSGEAPNQGAAPSSSQDSVVDTESSVVTSHHSALYGGAAAEESSVRASKTPRGGAQSPVPTPVPADGVELRSQLADTDLVLLDYACPGSLRMSLAYNTIYDVENANDKPGVAYTNIARSFSTESLGGSAGGSGGDASTGPDSPAAPPSPSMHTAPQRSLRNPDSKDAGKGGDPATAAVAAAREADTRGMVSSSSYDNLRSIDGIRINAAQSYLNSPFDRSVFRETMTDPLDDHWYNSVMTVAEIKYGGIIVNAPANSVVSVRLSVISPEALKYRPQAERRRPRVSHTQHQFEGTSSRDRDDETPDDASVVEACTNTFGALIRSYITNRNMPLFLTIQSMRAVDRLMHLSVDTMNALFKELPFDDGLAPFNASGSVGGFFASGQLSASSFLNLSRYDYLALSIAHSFLGLSIISGGYHVQYDDRPSKSKKPQQSLLSGNTRVLQRKSLFQRSSLTRGIAREVVMPPPLVRHDAFDLMPHVPKFILEILLNAYSISSRPWGLRFGNIAESSRMIASRLHNFNLLSVRISRFNPNRDTSGLINKATIIPDVIVIASRLSSQLACLARLIAESGVNVAFFSPLYEVRGGQELIPTQFLGDVAYSGDGYFDDYTKQNFGMHSHKLVTATGSYLETNLLHNFDWFYDHSDDSNKSLIEMNCTITEMLNRSGVERAFDQQGEVEKYMCRAKVLADYIRRKYFVNRFSQSPKAIICTPGFSILSCLSVSYMFGTQTVRSLHVNRGSVRANESTNDEDSGQLSSEYCYVLKPRTIFWATPNVRCLDGFRTDVLGMQFSDYNKVFSLIKDLSIPDNGVLDSFHPYMFYMMRAAILDFDHIAGSLDVLTVFRRLPWLNWALSNKEREIHDDYNGILKMLALTLDKMS